MIFLQVILIVVYFLVLGLFIMVLVSRQLRYRISNYFSYCGFLVWRPMLNRIITGRMLDLVKGPLESEKNRFVKLELLANDLLSYTKADGKSAKIREKYHLCFEEFLKRSDELEALRQQNIKRNKKKVK